MKILMVCLGNICRSPLAEGILKAKAMARQLAWEVESAGTGNWHIGHQPDPRSIAVAAAKGIDITDQRARQLNSRDFESFDLILAMDKSNYHQILALLPKAAYQHKVQMIMNYVYPNQDLDVPDPYWDDNRFGEVFDMLESACEAIIAHYELHTP